MTPQDFYEARRKLDMTQSQMGKMLGGVDDRTVRRWEDGERGIPGSVAMLIRLYLMSPSTLALAKRIAGV